MATRKKTMGRTATQRRLGLNLPQLMRAQTVTDGEKMAEEKRLENRLAKTEYAPSKVTRVRTKYTQTSEYNLHGRLLSYQTQMTRQIPRLGYQQ